jgi:molybdopterin synthase sulfur carrier subunit
MATLRLLYFAWLREHTGQTAEEFALTDTIQTAGDVVAALRARGPGYEAAFANPRLVRVAVNQAFADLQTAVGAGDEVAFFPPVTGG